ncbi:ABC transporter ATP-binding protein [Anaerosinus massiliensis]|uniref:ABC transporter ATP-binding protein n=1 Tax=Massilibacillus massiliensis TaxID=1806837 RepID=UPI000A71022D|nr:ABC transporter ATP-binding protein [Massilibacillus massiliensis]
MEECFVLAAEHVSVTIGQQQILDDLNLQAREGEFIGIIGPNGAGKSTFLKALRGLNKNISGSVKIFGKEMAQFDDKEIARKIAYMQQDVNLDFGFSVLKVVLAGRYPYLSWWQNEGKSDYEIARNYMRFTGVEDLAAKKVNQLSGGECQRVLLAKVLAQETPLLYLDEPTASLDLAYQEEIFRYCQKLCKEGKTILIVVHDIRLAAKFCSRLVLLADGKIIEDGRPEKVITKENLKQAFQLDAVVYKNPITGILDIHTLGNRLPLIQQKKVHIIGGNGSSGEMIRALYKWGFDISIGILEKNDIDAAVAEAFAVHRMIVPNYQQINAEQKLAVQRFVENADWVILTNDTYTEENYFNLELAFFSRNLIVIEDTPIDTRDFTQQKASRLYESLLQRKKVRVEKSNTFLKQFGIAIE